MEAVSSGHDNYELLITSCTAKYWDEGTDVPSLNVAIETFIVVTKKQNLVVSAAGILLLITRESS